ncbi:amidohydrolase family protein [Ramlibacter algicola]|uniref:Amidohydrolase n=1 Tax=Ramlibacter algicola TaxID=2795217 RepID=A0A934Q0M5_9BURK|nr:amidohydrolase family protein [Ramlibacter algicola]MBK0392553.1 amidohydrolase [Ramlibacter algicola]
MDLSTPESAARLQAPAAKKQSLQDYFVVSADSHVNEPHDLWLKRIDAQFRDRVPRVQVDEKGRKWFVVEGFRKSMIREAPRDEQVSVDEFRERSEAAGKRLELDRTKGAMFQQRGNPSADRYEDMDYDGIDAEILFPNKGLTNWSSPDSALHVAMCRVYNDWVHEVFGGSTRSFPTACVAPADIPACVAEIERVAKLGFHSVTMPPLVAGKGYNLPDYDPVWAALQETGMPVCFHAGTGKDPRTASGDGGAIINYVVHAMNTVLEPTVQLCASGVFDRFPGLNFATIEAGVGWVPYALWAMDHGFEKHAFWVSPKLKNKPSEYFKRHGHASFQDDPIGIETRAWSGIDSILWGNDYPHIEGTWPYSEQVTSRLTNGLTREEKAKIVGLNAARLFRIDVPADKRLPA